MSADPEVPAVITGSCAGCGHVIQRLQGQEDDDLCWWCDPETLPRRTDLQAKASKAIADLAASVSPTGPVQP